MSPGFDNADAYDRFMGRWSRPLAMQFVRFVEIEDGARALDVGCGTGALSAAILEGRPRAQVVGIDPSAAFVEAARQRVPGARARFEPGDAQALSLPDDSFDVAASMLVFNFIPDGARALGELRRVTRPGGRVAACVWDYAENTMLSRFWDAAAALDASAAVRHERGMPLTHAGELESLWRSGGLEDVRSAALTIDMRFESFDDYWQPFLLGVGPAGSCAVSLPEDRRGALERSLRASLWGDQPERPRVLPACAWAVRGTVPRA
jgi:SAM-dependent methyltransferase